MNETDIGNKAEQLAIKYLKKQGYKILETQYHVRPFAEIDIITIHKKDLAFIEVKYRKEYSPSFGETFLMVTKKKQNKIKITAQAFLKENKVKFNNISFDVISITEDNLEHIKNAFN